MKNQLIFWILLFILNIGNAQNPVPFPMQNVTWSVEIYNYSNDITIPDDCITRHYGYADDTLMDGNIYSKLYGNNLFIDFPYEDVEFNLATAHYVAGVRQDSTRKVWIRLPNETTDILYYDFDLEVGDTFCFDYFNGQCEEVAMVDSILIDGIWRKEIYFITTNGETWVDGIGSLTGWFEWQYTGTFSHKLNCFQTINNLIYQEGSCHCDTYDATSTQNFYWKKELKVFPSPTTELLNIQIPSKNTDVFTYTLYSIFGEKIKEKNSTSKTLQMNIKHLENGVYFLSIEDSALNIFTKKIIKVDQ